MLSDSIPVDHPTPVDAEMTVDYDPLEIESEEVPMDPVVVESGDGDAEMGEEETREGEVEEADMREYDDEIEVVEEVMGEVLDVEIAVTTGEEFEALQATDDEAAFSLPSPAPPAPVFGEVDSEPTTTPASLSLPEVDLAAVDPPDSATDAVVPPTEDAPLAKAERASEYTAEVEHTQVEPLEQEAVEVEAIATLDAPQLDEAPTTEEGDNEAAPPSTNGTAKLPAREPTPTPRSTTRPSIKNSLLSLVSLPSSLTSASATSSAPAILLSIANDTYSLFQRYTDASGQDVVPEIDGSLPVLFDDEAGQALYWGPVDELMDALHDRLPGLVTREEEIVLKFEDLGIDLSEDSTHTTEVSLSDFDRVHVGCGVPGRLHVSLETAPRFSTGFNALVDHIVNTYRADTTTTTETATLAIDDDFIAPIKGLEELENATVAELEAMLRAASEEGSEGEGGETYAEEMQGGEGDKGAQVEGEYEDGEWTEEGADGEYEEMEGDGGEPYDWDEALAELDSDDLAAVIEGVQEDYIESEGHEGEDYADAEEEVELELDAMAGEEVGEQEVVAPEVEEAAQVEDGLVVEEIVEEQPATSTEPPLAADSLTTATPAGVNGLNFSYDTPLGTGFEAPAIPLSTSTTTILDAAVSNSSAQVEEVEATGHAADVEELVDENDVVIDYEEVFDPSASLPSPPLAAISVAESTPTAPASLASEEILLSPKRSHSSLRNDAGLADDDAGAKRPRLADLVSTA